MPRPGKYVQDDQVVGVQVAHQGPQGETRLLVQLRVGAQDQENVEPQFLIKNRLQVLVLLVEDRCDDDLRLALLGSILVVELTEAGHLLLVAGVTDLEMKQSSYSTMNIFTKSNFWNYCMYSLLYCGRFWVSAVVVDCRYFWRSTCLGFVGLMPVMLDWGMLIILRLRLLPVGYSLGLYSTRLLSKFQLVLRLRAGGALSLSSSSLDSRISSFLGEVGSSYFLFMRLVIMVNSFSILLILTMSISMRFFFWPPIFSNLMPLLTGIAEMGLSLSLICGNLSECALFFLYFWSLIEAVKYNLLIIQIRACRMDLQTLHVSQLYQSTAMVAVLIVLVAEILACRHQLWNHISLVRGHENESEQLWIQDNSQQGQAEENAPDFEKSAIETIRREMSEFENKNIENEANVEPNRNQPEKQNQFQFLAELTPSKKSTLLFYLEYNNFLTEHVSIIFSILVLGMLTNSTRIYSLAAFFCYLFASLMFDFLHLEERLKAQYKRGVVLRRVVKIVSLCFILGLFVSYWAMGEFN